MKNQGVSANQLGPKAGVSPRTIGNLLKPEKRAPSASGKIPSPKLSELELVADGLGIEVFDLVAPPERLRWPFPDTALCAQVMALSHDERVEIQGLIRDKLLQFGAPAKLTKREARQAQLDALADEEAAAEAQRAGKPATLPSAAPPTKTRS